MPQCPKLLWVMIVFMVACFSVLEKTAQKQVCIRSFSFIVAKSSRTSIKQSQTLTTHNANRHCRVRFNTFVTGQPLSRQLYWVEYKIYTAH